MIIMFQDASTASYILATAITSISRLPADYPFPSRTRVTTSDKVGLYVFEDSREDFERNLAAWRDAVTPKPVADPSAGISRNPC